MPGDHARTFAHFYFLIAFAQTIVITVSPLKAYELLGSAQAVSVLYVIVGVATFFGRLLVPRLIRFTSLSNVFMVGAFILIMAAALLATNVILSFVVGLVLNAFALACLEIAATIYLLDHIPRLQLTPFERKRIFYSAAAWTIAPWLGVYLKVSIVEWMPFAVEAGIAAILLVYFYLWKLSARSAGRITNPKLDNFSAYVPHFFAQPRLRLAWVLASGRSSWWAMFFIYAPIYAVVSGLGEQVGGLIVSAGALWIWLVPLWGWIARHVQLRRLLIFAYLASGLCTIMAATVTSAAWGGASLLVLSALFAAMIDAAGNSLFLRAVRSYERSEMTAVYISFRDVSQTAPPAVFSVLLASFSLSAVFLTGGLMMLIMAGVARYIPRGF